MRNWWSGSWFAVCMRIMQRHKDQKMALTQEIVALQKQNEVLKKLLSSCSQREQSMKNKTEILQRMAAHRVVQDAQRFLEEG
jgi:hypothetical protein